MKNISLLSDFFFFQFLEVNFSIYLNRRVFVMLYYSARQGLNSIRACSFITTLAFFNISQSNPAFNSKFHFNGRFG